MRQAARKEMREKIAAIILKNKKLLLVAGYNAPAYWTPGGRREKGESRRQTLVRELKEELGLRLVSSRFYLSFLSSWHSFGAKMRKTGKKRKIFCYIVKCSGRIAPSAEITKVFWYGRKEFERGSSKIFISDETEKSLIPKLIQDGLF